MKTTQAAACSVCFYGSPDEPMNIGLRYAIIALIGFLLIPMALLTKFFLSYRKRAQIILKAEGLNYGRNDNNRNV